MKNEFRKNSTDPFIRPPIWRYVLISADSEAENVRRSTTHPIAYLPHVSGPSSHLFGYEGRSCSKVISEARCSCRSMLIKTWMLRVYLERQWIMPTKCVEMMPIPPQQTLAKMLKWKITRVPSDTLVQNVTSCMRESCITRLVQNRCSLEWSVRRIRLLYWRNTGAMKTIAFWWTKTKDRPSTNDQRSWW